MRFPTRLIAGASIALALGVFVFIEVQGSSAVRLRTCVYSAETHANLAEFDRLVGHRIACVQVFNNQETNWTGWQDPWFITNPGTNANWVSFARRPGDLLIITMDLFPRSEIGVDWLSLGAEGRFTSHARILARNLVRAGMGDSIIRLAPEANGSWYDYSVPDTPGGDARWRRFWRLTVLAMRSVPGAHFSFDWCIAAGVRPIPFADYYPGNDVVDTVGADIYDTGVPAGINDRWRYQYTRPGGLRAIAAFARAHDKPLAIPEWGLAPAAAGGGGADPGFVAHFARFLHRVRAAFQCYFFTGELASQLSEGSTSLKIYRSQLAPQS